MERARIQAGNTVLVLGALGGVGVASTQLAKALGAGIVTAGVRGEEDALVARQAGTDALVFVAGDDLRDRMRDEVRHLISGRGSTWSSIRSAGPPAAALRAIAWCGRMVIVGFAAGDIPQIPANYLLVRNIEV